jgi:cytidylate kinase
MKQILLIDREFGAGGSTIGEKLAARLKWKLFDQALSEEIAKLAKIPVHECRKREERPDPMLHKLVNIIWRGSFMPNPTSAEEAVLDTHRLTGLIEKVVLEAAEKKPCVIVGRGAPYFLRNRKDIFSVFLYASRDLKYHRVLKRVGGRESEAIELVDTIDDDRRKFVKQYFGHEWPKRELFDVMLNTGMGDDETVETILRLLEDANRHEGVKKA